jgi:hypothetical protein
MSRFFICAFLTGLETANKLAISIPGTTTGFLLNRPQGKLVISQIFQPVMLQGINQGWARI